ncbi:MAG: potassium transporter KefB [Firmicutes bacterium]|nr:potassium transporter KefB [Bacillota bacterium]
MEIPMLNDIIIIIGLSIFVIFGCQKLRIPGVVGLLITGVVAGPNGLGLVQGVHDVEVLAEIGIILLLFTIGIEFSLGQLLQIRKTVLLGGGLQVLLTTLGAMFLMSELGHSRGESVFIGFLVSLSSTAIVLKLLQDRLEVDSPHGRNVLGILIFQDIAIVPMILLTPLLAGSAGGLSEPPYILLAKGIAVMLLVVACAKWVVPFLLYQIARLKNRELFLISIVAICLSVAWLTSSIGLSLSLGAFLAGLIVSESEYSHHALGNILPFKDVFTSFFFVSIGMLLDVGFLFEQPLAVSSITLGVMVAKTIIAGLVVIALGFPIRTALLAGLALGQVGEFAFVLSRTGIEYNLFTGNTYQLFLAVSVLTMALTPFCISLGPVAANFLMRLPLPKRLKTGVNPGIEVDEESLTDHLIIIGFGVNGKNLARAATAAGIPYIAIEMNPDTVRQERESGEPIFFGDATHAEVLRHANLKRARVVVVAISDPAASVRVADLIRKMDREVHIIVRTRYIQEIEPLYQVGANEVIPEEFETSIEIFTLVLKKYLVPRDEIEKFIAEVRSDGYEMLRTLSRKSATFNDIKLHHHNAEIITFKVGERSFVAGKTLTQIELRSRYGVSLLLIRRGEETILNPGGDTQILAHDAAIVLGSPDDLAEVTELFHNPDEEEIL